MQDLGLDTKDLGLLSAAFFYAFAVTQIPISILLDRIGPRIMMTVLSLIGVAGAIVFALSDSLGTGLAGRALLGIGMACNLMGTLKLLTVWFGPLSFATLSGTIFAIGTMGNIAATSPLVLLVQHMGWRWTYFLIAGINLIITLVLYIIVRDSPEQKTFAQSQQGTTSLGKALSDLRILLKMKDYWVISLGTFVSYGIFASFQALWAGPYLMEVIGLPAIHAGNLIFLMNLGLIIGGPVWGALSDRIFRTRKWIILAGTVSSSFLVLSLTRLSYESSVIILSLFFLGFGLSRATGLLMYAHIKELMPIEMAGTAMTGINFFTMIGSAVFLQGLGALMQHLYPCVSRGPDAFNAAFLICGACLVVVSLLYLLTKDNT